MLLSLSKYHNNVSLITLPYLNKFWLCHLIFYYSQSFQVMEQIKLKIGVLAVQGAFLEHKQCLESLDRRSFKGNKLEVIEIRSSDDIDNDMDGLILPGNYGRFHVYSLVKNAHN